MLHAQESLELYHDEKWNELVVHSKRSHLNAMILVLVA